MDLDVLLSARREAQPAAPSLPADLAAAERDLLAAHADLTSVAVADWMRSAARVVAEHQRLGHPERVWPLLRLMEPMAAGLAGSDPASAARVHAVLATQALIEGAAEAFLDRSGRAAAAFDKAGDHPGEASVERAAHGTALLALGVDDEAERALDAAIDGAARANLRIAEAAARHARARLALRRGRADEARALTAPGSLEPTGPSPASIGWLAGGPAPAWISLADARAAAGDARGAAEALAEARRSVLAFASRLQRADLRKSYLERIPEHRRALSLDSA